MRKQGFLKGALILSVAGIIVKIMGAVNKIFLSRILGGEGIGLYQMAYPIYYIVTSLAIAGIPIAISIMIAEKLANKDMRGAHRVFQVSLLALTVTGLICGALLYFGATFLVDMHIVYDPRAIMAVKALAPAIPVVTVMSCFRGYFQGFQDMLPTGVSQIGEQFVRVVTMFTFAWLLLDWGLDYAAAGAAFATLPGGLMALVILLGFYYRQWPLRRQLYETADAQVVPESMRRILWRLCVLAVPVSIANILMPIMAGIDLVIVPTRLAAAGFSAQEVTTAFGYLTGMANSLVNLPVIVTMALAASLVPAISEAKALGRQEEIRSRTDTAMKIAYLITLPASMGLLVLATPISKMLYATEGAGPAIAVLSYSIFFLGLQQVTTGVLQGLGRPMVPMINLAGSMVVKVVLTWVPTALPWLGIKGAALATDIDFALALALNMGCIYYFTRCGIQWKVFGKIFLATVIMGLGAYILHFLTVDFVGNTVAVCSAIIVAVILYGGALIALRVATREEWRQMPGVGKFIK